MKNKKIVSYPYVLYSPLGYSAVISQLEDGYYRFYVTTPKGYPEFDWIEHNADAAEEDFDAIKYDLLKTFLAVTLESKQRHST